jgi:hypothetical protein
MKRDTRNQTGNKFTPKAKRLKHSEKLAKRIRELKKSDANDKR